MPTRRGLDFSFTADDDISPAPEGAAAGMAGGAAPSSMRRGSGSAHITTPMFSPLVMSLDGGWMSSDVCFDSLNGDSITSQ